MKLLRIIALTAALMITAIPSLTNPALAGSWGGWSWSGVVATGLAPDGTSFAYARTLTLRPTTSLATPLTVMAMGPGTAPRFTAVTDTPPITPLSAATSIGPVVRVTPTTRRNGARGKQSGLTEDHVIADPRGMRVDLRTS